MRGYFSLFGAFLEDGKDEPSLWLLGRAPGGGGGCAGGILYAPVSPWVLVVVGLLVLLITVVQAMTKTVLGAQLVLPLPQNAPKREK